MKSERLCLERKDQGRSTVSPALGALEPMGQIRLLRRADDQLGRNKGLFQGLD